MPLGKRADYGDARFAGVQVQFTEDVESTLRDVSLCGFDFLIAPLTTPTYRPPSPVSAMHDQLLAPFSLDNVMYLGTSEYNNQVVGAVSSWIEPDSADPQLREQSTAALKHELGWAAHLGIQAVLLPAVPQPLQGANYAGSINQALHALSHMVLWLTVPLSYESSAVANGHPEPGEASGSTVNGMQSQVASHTRMDLLSPNPADSWETWNQVRTLCDHHNLLGCALLLTQSLPKAEQLARWLGEPVKAVLVPTTLFSSNKRGYPILSKAHQDFISLMFKHGVQVVLSGEPCHTVPPSAPPTTRDPVTGIMISDPGVSHPLRPYWEYLGYLFRKLELVPRALQEEAAYRDFLQAPLQPLQDNLESATYEVFEKDTTKYTLYEEAVYKALTERHANASKPVVLMVVGAGRGPLVRASLQAAARARCPLKVYAVEKNPNALVHIQHMLRTEGWEQQVTLVSADMRHWQAPEPAQILVSELLGSFGDNELSPECLDGAQRFLAPDGISIPESYTSYLAPVTTHKLWNDVKNYKDLEHFEMPYVVRLFRHHLLAPPKPFFTFTHPNTAKVIDNTRYQSTTFHTETSQGSGLLHGFAGYFECELYKGVLLSIHPDTHSPNMFSWFPIYFPLKEPVYVPAGAPVTVQLWRRCASHKVWYEWSISQPAAQNIHNVGGRSYWVGL